MEKLMVAKPELQMSKRQYSAVRAMAMLWHQGSVIPLFVKQIKEGKPLTITDPNMTRFLMSLEDSVDLVVYAFQHANRVIYLCRRPRHQRSWTWRLP